ncbi:MAG: hypothetical protein HY244_11435 [Rhizobiales bacterium]|nr:hypothetical protein [Hyphomicrobiales bacterium]
MTSQAQPARGRPALIETKRKRLFAELTMLREMRGPSARAAETAQHLLTRWWAKANWRKREQLLRAADWLIRLESNHGA